MCTWTDAISGNILLFGVVLMPVAGAQGLVPDGDFRQGFPPLSSAPPTDEIRGAIQSVTADNANGYPTVPSARLASTLPGDPDDRLAGGRVPA